MDHKLKRSGAPRISRGLTRPLNWNRVQPHQLSRGFLLDRKNFFGFVIAAMWAHVMRQAHLVAIGAWHQVGCLQGEVAAAAVAASLGCFPFW